MEIDPLIETQRLYLRPLVSSDLEDLLEYHGNSNVVRYIPWSVRNRDDVDQALRVYQAMPSALVGEGDAIVLGWALKDTGKIIGQSNGTLVSAVNQTSDFGWVAHQRFWRHGYAYEASQAFLAFLMRHQTVQRVIANIDTRNPESARLAEKLGMRLEGEFRKSLYQKGEWCDMWHYAILKEEFLAANQKA